MADFQELNSKDINKYIRIIKKEKMIGDQTWDKIVTDFHTKIKLNPKIDYLDNFPESNCIVKYHHVTKNFTIYNFLNQENYDNDMTLVDNSGNPVTEHDIIKYGTPLFTEFLRQIEDMTKSEIKNDYFFLVRLIKRFAL